MEVLKSSACISREAAVSTKQSNNNGDFALVWAIDENSGSVYVEEAKIWDLLVEEEIQAEEDPAEGCQQPTYYDEPARTRTCLFDLEL